MDTDIDLREHRYAVFCEARKAGTRAQYVVYAPNPAIIGHGLKNSFDGGSVMMRRTLSPSKGRAKWSWYRATSPAIATELVDRLVGHDNAGWTVMEPVLVFIEDDDFKRVYSVTDSDRWSPRTPYKMLRAVDRILAPRGYRVTGTV